MPSTEFEPKAPPIKRLQTYAFDCATPGISTQTDYGLIIRNKEA
jgi:hypothetical protein